MFAEGNGLQVKTALRYHVSTYCCVILSNRAGARRSVTRSGTVHSAHTGQTDRIPAVPCALVSDRSCLTLRRILLLQTEQGCHYTYS